MSVAAGLQCIADRGLSSLCLHGGGIPPVIPWGGRHALPSEYSCSLLWCYCYTGQAEMPGRETHLLFFRRSLPWGHLSAAACAPTSVGVMDLGCGGDIIHVCLFPRLCHSSEGDISYAQYGCRDMSSFGPF